VSDEYEFITIRLIGSSASGKTSIFDVRSKKGGYLLGRIVWYSHWRQYAFSPVGATVYSAGCLRDIADFIKSAMEKRR
jgi:hypothetical protein